MAATPQDRVAVGSAINDTTREVGGALGVAVLGSVLASVYRQGLPTELLDVGQLEVARSSIGAALELARGDPALAALATSARDAFTDGFRVALATAAVVAALAALLTSRLGLPRPRDVGLCDGRRSVASVAPSVAVGGDLGTVAADRHRAPSARLVG